MGKTHAMQAGPTTCSSTGICTLVLTALWCRHSDACRERCCCTCSIMNSCTIFVYMIIACYKGQRLQLVALVGIVNS
jgi:hypothetical protein